MSKKYFVMSLASLVAALIIYPAFYLVNYVMCSSDSVDCTIASDIVAATVCLVLIGALILLSILCLAIGLIQKGRK